MKTNRVLAGVLALTLTAGGAVYIPELSATAYAAENDTLRLGDVNHDGTINNKDRDAIMDHINGVTPLDDTYIWAADVNEDGLVDVEDAAIITNHINKVKLIKEKYKSLALNNNDDDEEKAPIVTEKPIDPTPVTTTTSEPVETPAASATPEPSPATTPTNTMTKDNYAHNFDYTAWDVWTPDAYEHSIDPSLLCPKANEYNDKVCVFTTITCSSNSVNYTDHFYDKEAVEDDSFELMAEAWGFNGNYRIFANTKDHFNLGKIKYETIVVDNGEKGKEIIGPRKADTAWSGTSFVYLHKNMTIYCNPDTKIYYYTSHNPYPYDELQRITDDKVGYFNRDGSITLLPNVIRLGDTNHDNVIDIEDATAIVNHINGVKALDDEYIWAADVNGDDIVDIDDVNAINDHINGVKSFEKELEKDNYKILSDSKENTSASADSTTTEPQATEATPVVSEIPGDINGDEKIDISDLSKLAIVLVDKEELSEDFIKRADIDKDGKVTLTDLAVLRQFISKKITEF